MMGGALTKNVDLRLLCRQAKMVKKHTKRISQNDKKVSSVSHYEERY